LVFENQAIEDCFYDIAFVLGHVADGLELEGQILRGAAFVLFENEIIQADVESFRQPNKGVQRGLGFAGLIASDLIDMNANGISQGLLGEVLDFSELDEARSKHRAQQELNSFVHGNPLPLELVVMIHRIGYQETTSNWC
jgi:hypothetical protein